MTGIGSKVWVFDGNRRVYAKDAKGRATGGPIWREHWCPHTIASENRRSWITNYRVKIPKRGFNPRRVAFSIDEIEEQAWVKEHHWRIADKMRHITDAAVLRQIAALVGYQP